MKGDGYLYQVGKVWYVGYKNAEGKNVRESAKTTDKEIAQKTLRALVGNAAQGIIAVGAKADRVTLSDAFAALRADYEEKCNRTIAPVDRTEGHAFAFFGEKTKLSKIEKARIQQYIAKRRTQLIKRKGVMRPPAVATINGELRLIRRAFWVLVEAKKLNVDDVPGFNIDASKENVRKGFIEPADFAKLVEALPDDLKDPVAFLYHSGSRLDEMRTLEWQDIDLEESTFTIRAENAKNKTARTLKLRGELLAIIQRQLARRTKFALVFLRDGNKRDDGTREAPSEPIGDFRKAWRNACTMAEIGSFVIHDMRRSAAKNLTRALVPQRVAMAITGHKTASMFLRYSIVDQRELDDAATLVDQYVRERAAEHVEERPALLN